MFPPLASGAPPDNGTHGSSTFGASPPAALPARHGRWSDLRALG